MNGHYQRTLTGNGVEIVRGFARFVGPKAVEVNGETLTADHIVIAVGGRPIIPDSRIGTWHHIGRIFRDRGPAE